MSSHCHLCHLRKGLSGPYLIFSHYHFCDWSRTDMSYPDMIFVKSFTQAAFQQIWKFTRRMRKPRHFLPPKTLFLAFESQKCDIHSLSSWNMYFLHLTISTLSKTSKNIWNYTRNFFTMRNFTQSWNKFTQALLVMLVTNIKSACVYIFPRNYWRFTDHPQSPFWCNPCYDCWGCPMKEAHCDQWTPNPWICVLYHGITRMGHDFWPFTPKPVWQPVI